MGSTGVFTWGMKQISPVLREHYEHVASLTLRAFIAFRVVFDFLINSVPGFDSILLTAVTTRVLGIYNKFTFIFYLFKPSFSCNYGVIVVIMSKLVSSE